MHCGCFLSSLLFFFSHLFLFQWQVRGTSAALLVATPGRLIDFMERNIVSLQHVKCVLPAFPPFFLHVFCLCFSFFKFLFFSLFVFLFPFFIVCFSFFSLFIFSSFIFLQKKTRYLSYFIFCFCFCFLLR